MTSLEIRAISHAFGHNVVLRDVSLSLPGGKLYGVIGPNGAGKTTLLRIVAGLLRPTRGAVAVAGAVLAAGSVSAARAAGVGYIAQDLSQIDVWTVAEQLAHELADASARAEVFTIANELGVKLDPSARIEHMSVVARQVLEIAKGLARLGPVLLIDEPTTGLETAQRDALYARLRARAQRGDVVLAVSHDLERLRQVGDAFLVVAEGGVTYAAEFPSSKLDGAFDATQSSAAAAGEAWVIECAAGRVAVGAGEILGIHGPLRTGVQNVLRDAFGLGGACRVAHAGDRWKANTRAALARGMAYISRDRLEEWGFQDQPMWFNLVSREFARQRAFSRASDASDRKRAGDWMRKGGIRPPSSDMAFEAFSGGNRQKAVVFSALHSQANVLLLDEPLSGIDHEARIALSASLRDFVSSGRSVLIYSQEVGDLRSMSSRIIEFGAAAA